MTLIPKKAQTEFAKIITAACVRRGYLEKLHCGTTPVTRTGDYSDVKVIDAEGREIPWNEVSRINQNENADDRRCEPHLHFPLTHAFFCNRGQGFRTSHGKGSYAMDKSVG